MFFSKIIFLLILWEFHTTYFDHIHLPSPTPSKIVRMVSYPCVCSAQYSKGKSVESRRRVGLFRLMMV